MITGTVIVKLELSSQLGDKTTDYRVELNSKLWLHFPLFLPSLAWANLSTHDTGTGWE